MVIDFRRNKSEIPNSIVNDKPIEGVSSYTYPSIEMYDQLKFKICKILQHWIFLLRKLNYFQVDSIILELFYKTVLQSVLSSCLVCVFGKCAGQNGGRGNGKTKINCSVW